MENLVVLIVSVIISAVGGLIAIIVARQKGLPDLNKEIEGRMSVLNDTLDEQLQLSNKKFADLQSEFTSCKARLDEALNENGRLTRRLRLAEADLLTLFRGQGREPPSRLTDEDL